LAALLCRRERHAGLIFLELKMAEFVSPVESITDQKMHRREGILLLIINSILHVCGAQTSVSDYSANDRYTSKRSSRDSAMSAIMAFASPSR
jgi:hypothetical protein